MGSKVSRVRIILFRDRLQRGKLTQPQMGLINWMGAQHVRTLPNVNGLICTLPPNISDQKILSTDGVVAVEENFKISLVPWAPKNFKGFSKQVIPWGVHYIGADACWQETKGQGAKVAVIDSGINPNHPNLRKNLQGGINLISPGSSFDDDNGHGTHVAGTIAASNTGKGILGVAPEAAIYAVKVLDQWGDGTILNAINALDWCIKNNINIVNMSFGTDKYSRALEEAVREARKWGLLIVAAAGNDGGPGTVDYPAVFKETISVAALNTKGELADFSSSGPEIDLLAPGSNILSTYRWGTYVRLSGSSMAAAHVTGAMALLKAKYPNDNSQMIVRRLLTGAKGLKGKGSKFSGAGVVRVDVSINS